MGSQLPEQQSSSDWQTVPQPPQLFGSDCVSSQVPLQHMPPAAQPQVPPQPSSPPQETPLHCGAQPLLLPPELLALPDELLLLLDVEPELPAELLDAEDAPLDPLPVLPVPPELVEPPLPLVPGFEPEAAPELETPPLVPWPVPLELDPAPPLDEPLGQLHVP